MSQQNSHPPGPEPFEMLASRIQALRVLHDVIVDLGRLREQEMAFGRRLEEMQARLDDTLRKVRGEQIVEEADREFGVRVEVTR